MDKKGFLNGLLEWTIAIVVTVGIVLLYIAYSDSTDDTDYEGVNRHSEEVYNTSAKYPWIVGTWSCTTPHGAITLVFNGDGQWGTCSELMYGSYKIGTYTVDGNTLRYKLDGESWSNTVEIRGNRLYLGDGYYLNKK